MASEKEDQTVELIVASGFILLGIVLGVIAFLHELSLPTFLVPVIAIGGGAGWLNRLRR